MLFNCWWNDLIIEWLLKLVVEMIVIEWLLLGNDWCQMIIEDCYWMIVVGMIVIEWLLRMIVIEWLLGDDCRWLLLMIVDDDCSLLYIDYNNTLLISHFNLLILDFWLISNNYLIYKLLIFSWCWFLLIIIFLLTIIFEAIR